MATGFFSRISRRDLYNAVRGTFVSPDAYWQPTDFPTVSNATYATNDGGQVIWRDMALPFTTSRATAQRIAKLVLERSRIAERWRTERWDSLRLLTPNWQSRLPGYGYEGNDPDGYRTMPEVIAFIDERIKILEEKAAA